MRGKSNGVVPEMGYKMSAEGPFTVTRGNGNEEKGANSYDGCYYNVGFRVNRPIFLTELFFLGPARMEANDMESKKFNEGKHDYSVKLYISHEEEIWLDSHFSSIKWNTLFACLGPCGKSYYRIVDLMPPKRFKVNHVAVEEMFSVKLDSPVYIPPNVWISVKFELDGPKTENAKIGYMGGQKVVENVAIFEFDTGAHQLPSFAFRVAEEDEIMKA